MWPIANSQRKKKAAANDILGLLAYHPSCGLVGFGSGFTNSISTTQKKGRFLYLYLYLPY